MNLKQLFTISLCITLIIITIVVMPNDGDVFPESVDKARELCKDHGGVKRLIIADYANFTTKFNRVIVTCENGTDITTLLNKRYR